MFWPFLFCDGFTYFEDFSPELSGNSFTSVFGFHKEVFNDRNGIIVTTSIDRVWTARLVQSIEKEYITNQIT